MAEETFTMRNRRSPALRAADADDRPRRSRFVVDTHAVKPSTPAVPVWPYGDLSRAGADELAKFAAEPMFGADLASSAAKRRRGARRILIYLLGFEGATWQKRWEASGLDVGEYPISCLAEDMNRGYETTYGLRALLFMRVIRPSIPAFRVNKFHDYPNTFRASQRDPLLDKFFEEAARSRAAPRHQWRALFDITCALTTQGIALSDLGPEGLLYYADQCRQLQLVVHGRKGSNRFAGLLAWEILHGMGHFPPDTSPTLRAGIYRGQKTVEEMVDFYGVRDPAVRQLIIDYIVRRQGDTDYVTREGFARHIAGEFWARIEQLDPRQRGLAIPSDLYDQWHAAMRLRRDGKPRADGGQSILLAIRSFYMDIQSWALEEPERWAAWAAPCPIPPADLRGIGTRRRRVNERTANRIRERQPLLPALVAHVETRYTTIRSFYDAAIAIPLGDTFTHDGRTYARLDGREDRRRAESPTPLVRVRDLATTAIRLLTDEEEQAFWDWAYVEVLRHTGIRVEELVELTHTSIRQYQRPNGEIIALLVIAPSKSDRERVIPMSAELFHVVAKIVMRQTASGPIPLLPRYDGHERVWIAPMPYLFQRQIGEVRRVTSTGTVLVRIQRQCEILAETNPAFQGLHFTPHDFRRLFATDLVNNGLPIHIGAALLGHLNLQTTQGYVAVFEEDVIRHVQEFMDRRRATRPHEEYRPITDQEWHEFEEHFDKRKVELGSCGRPYGSPCQHEHACLRCPQLHVNPKMVFRLDELEADLEARRWRAAEDNWLGEIEGIDRTLACLRDKRADAARLTSITRNVSLGLPAVPTASSS
ncbi:site-specific integrase [Nocardia terpenica]|uniref:tyrosine-type recombinase/integrase n=1 Tax=Nocardia terpenica TaxID=455432 RepID=UPI002FE13815